MQRLIFVGDVHGCREEFDELVKLCDYKRGRDRLICLGDLVDRGPDPVGVVRRVQEIGAESLMGNHEEKLVRYFGHEATRGTKKNPVSVAEDRLVQWREIDKAGQVEYLASLPRMLPVGRYIAVHAGLEPLVPLGEQRPNTLLRVRWVHPDTKKAVSGLDPPPGSVAWMDLWEGPQTVVFGHAVWDMKHPVASTFAIGLDTGCCFGGRLTALVTDSTDQRRGYVQVEAKAKHAKLHASRVTQMTQR